MTWKVSLCDIDLDEAEQAAVARVIRSRWITMGKGVAAFEEEFRGLTGARRAFAVANGTAALHIALAALGVGPGDEVICPALTFVATANAVLYVGGRPIFADIESLDCWNLSAEDVERSITPHTRAILVVHYAGFAADINTIVAIAQRHNLAVVEDAAHAPGARDASGRHLGTIGDVGCFSFFSNKNLTTGEGGMVVTDGDEPAEKIRRLRSHGMTTLTLERHKGHAYSYDVTDLGFNYRMDEIRAALGRVQLSKLKRNNNLRRQRYEEYIQGLEGIKGLRIPFRDRDYGQPSYHIFPVMLEDAASRQPVMEHLKAKGIQSSIHYPSIPNFTLYRNLPQLTKRELPLSLRVSESEITLPLYPHMGAESVEYVVKSLKEILK